MMNLVARGLVYVSHVYQGGMGTNANARETVAIQVVTTEVCVTIARTDGMDRNVCRPVRLIAILLDVIDALGTVVSV